VSWTAVVVSWRAAAVRLWEAVKEERQPVKQRMAEETAHGEVEMKVARMACGA